MNEHRKSDKPIVAASPSNKTGRKLVAERVEPRGLAKGKPVRQNMIRTQSREVMQSALERVRQAAKRDKDLSSLSPAQVWRYYLRQEPSALAVPAGICAGGSGLTGVPTAT